MFFPHLYSCHGHEQGIKNWSIKSSKYLKACPKKFPSIYTPKKRNDSITISLKLSICPKATREIPLLCDVTIRPIPSIPKNLIQSVYDAISTLKALV